MAKTIYPPSKGVGEQVRGMFVSCNSIFQAGNHDVLAFSVSSIFVEKIFAIAYTCILTLK